MSETVIAPGTAAARIMETLRQLSKPEPGANEMELSLGTIAMALESRLGPELAPKQASGELDEFVLALTRFLAAHRSDSATQLVVVELPRHDVPNRTRVQFLEEGIEAQREAGLPW